MSTGYQHDEQTPLQKDIKFSLTTSKPSMATTSVRVRRTNEELSKDDQNPGDRPRWRNRATFVTAVIGNAIGVGNVYRFPYLTFKHDGVSFLLAYLWVLVVAGIPLLILELTLGQKMQRGSAGAMRGIVPRLAGFGWVASFCGFVTCMIYNVVLGMCLVYLVNSGSQPWSSKNFNPTRPLACQTAAMMPTPAEEVYLYLNVTKLYGSESCSAFQEGDESNFAGGLFIANLLCWVFITSSLAVGPKVIELKALVSVPLRFILIIVFVINYAGLNADVNGDGQAWYLGGAKLPLPTQGGEGGVEYRAYDAEVASQLFSDAYQQVFFSIGVCYGTLFAYGSYNKTRQPIIQAAFIIGFVDLLFSFIAGFGVWGGIGYLQKLGKVAYSQNNSIGLLFVAMPAAAVESGNSGTFGLLCFTLWMSGIDSAVGFVQSGVTNTIDATGCPRWQAALGICTCGIILSSVFTSNYGWVLFDMVDHYLSNYILLGVGICECVAVGWIFERRETAEKGDNYARSMRALVCLFWVPLLIISFYASFAFPQIKSLGVVLIVVFTLIAFAASFYLSKLPLQSWYHEIVLCGTDKLAMSITALSVHNTQERRWWMGPFEAYFGMTIKFVNPACLTFFIFEAAAADIAQPYGITQGYMTSFASIYFILALFIIFMPMMMCDHPEEFQHDMPLEFCADEIHEVKDRIMAKLGEKLHDAMQLAEEHRKSAAGAGGAADAKPQPVVSINGEEDRSNHKDIELVEIPLDDKQEGV